jgi:hypothetical protein
MAIKWSGYGYWPTGGRSRRSVVITWIRIRREVTRGCSGRERRVPCNKHTSIALVTATETTAVRCRECGGIWVGGKRKIGRRKIRIGVKIQDVGFVTKYLVQKYCWEKNVQLKFVQTLRNLNSSF